MSSEIVRLHDVKSQVMVLSHGFDVNSLSHIRQSSLRRTHQTHCHLMATTSICVVAFLEILYLSLHLTIWLHVVFPRTLFPNPVPLNKIPLLYHLNRDEEHTLRTRRSSEGYRLHDLLITTSQLITLQYASFNHYHCHTTVTNSLLSLLYHAIVRAE